jgi:predicted DNA-binding protein (MmcQ/YjbR family)
MLNVTESFPFDDVSLVFKVEDKMFLLMGLDNPEPLISVKCEPEMAVQLRDHYNAVEPAYHFNKKYWNQIYLNRDMNNTEIKKWILHSYHEVILKLPKNIHKKYSNE